MVSIEGPPVSLLERWEKWQHTQCSQGQEARLQHFTDSLWTFSVLWSYSRTDPTGEYSTWWFFNSAQHIVGIKKSCVKCRKEEPSPLMLIASPAKAVSMMHPFFASCSHSSRVWRYQLVSRWPLCWVVFWEEFIHRIWPYLPNLIDFL